MSKDYWIKRQEKAENLSFDKGTKTAAKFVKNLKQAEKEINEKIAALVGKYMGDTGLNKVEAMKLLKGDEYREWRKTIGGYVTELNSMQDKNSIAFKKLSLELETLAYRSRITRLGSLKAEIQMELIRAGEKNNEALTKTLEDVYKKTYTDLVGDLGTKATVDFDRVKEVLGYEWSGANYSSRVWNNTDKLAETIKSALVQGMNQGINYKTISKRISEKFNTSYKNAERLVRTEVNYMHNQATLDGYKEAGVEKYEFSATIDHRTSHICSSLNGEIFELDKAAVGINYPPMHVRCRSTTLPVIDYSAISSKKDLQEEEKESKIEFKEATSIKEANEFAKSILGINADYKGLDVRCANEWNKGLFEMNKKFPEIIREIKFVGSSQRRNALIKKDLLEIYDIAYVNKYMKHFKISKENMAQSLFVKNDTSEALSIVKKYSGITMNDKKFNDYDGIIDRGKELVKMGWKPMGCGTVKSTFDHEFAHQIDAVLNLEGTNKEIRKLYFQNEEEKGKNLSIYSVNNKVMEVNIGETIAEAWAEYCNNPVPREIAKGIGEIIEKEWEKWKKNQT